MNRLLAAALFLTVTALPARATEWLDCGDAENTVNFRVLLGMMDVIAVNNIEIEAKGRKWSTTPAEGVTTVTRGQAFETPDQMWIDVTDENVNAIVAKLRVFKVSEIVEGSDDGVFDATGGTLQMPGVGAWAVRCSGP